MALPINIEDLLNKRKVESNRIEFKADWNPDKIYHTICAFATDLENTGGGYILVGVEEENGVAKRPVKGLSTESIDRILKDMVGYDAKISPAYMSKVSPENVDDKTILVIWVPSGSNRPYSVMESVVAKKSVPKFYVRNKASTIEAKGEILDQVRELANRVPFDERGNETIQPEDISGVLVYEHLKAVRSKLADNEKSDKTYNYPYQAFEEAVVNALYHRDYQEREPVEITIEPTHVDILSYAGPDRSISAEVIKAARKLKARRYRNRRLGDFLKELDLTEGRATGIPSIQKALKENGSDSAIIETDDDRTYFLMTIPCRQDMVNTSFQATVSETQKDLDGQLLQILGQTSVQVQDIVYQNIIADKHQLLQILGQISVQVWDKSKAQVDKLWLAKALIDTICILEEEEISAQQLNRTLSFGDIKDLKRKILIPLINMDYVAMTNPDKPTSSKQEYTLTDKGRKLFE